MKTLQLALLLAAASAVPGISQTAVAADTPLFDLKDVAVPPKLVAMDDTPIRRLGNDRGHHSWSASAQVDFVVDHTGAAQHIQVACTDSELRRAVYRVVSQARFRPGRKDGEAVSVRMHLLETVRWNGDAGESAQIEAKLN